MTTLIAWRNIAQDPVRFLATLVGIVFAIVLMGVQMGMLLGFSETTTGLIRNSRADVWILPTDTSNVDQADVLQQRAYFQALRNPRVAAASRHIVRFVIWRRPHGGAQLVIVVGFDPRHGLSRPWNIVEGSIEDLKLPHTIMIDRLYANKLGITSINQSVEINNKRAIVVGFTEGIRTFTQAPYVFTTYDNALRYTDIADGDANYVLIRATAEAETQHLIQDLQSTAVAAEVLSSEAFAERTRDYWIRTTGAGAALILGATLGALVGAVILAQTLYAATMERLAEYATLAAIGAGPGYLNAIVIKQALICGGTGYVLGMVISSMIALAAREAPVAIVLSMPVMILIGLGTMVMCSMSAVLAVRKLSLIDPTSVFR